MSYNKSIGYKPIADHERQVNSLLKWGVSGLFSRVVAAIVADFIVSIAIEANYV